MFLHLQKTMILNKWKISSTKFLHLCPLWALTDPQMPQLSLNNHRLLEGALKNCFKLEAQKQPYNMVKERLNDQQRQTI